MGDRGIRENPLVPGAIATDFGGGFVRDNQHVNGRPDDIGAAVPAISVEVVLTTSRPTPYTWLVGASVVKAAADVGGEGVRVADGELVGEVELG